MSIPVQPDEVTPRKNRTYVHPVERHAARTSTMALQTAQVSMTVRRPLKAHVIHPATAGRQWIRFVDVGLAIVLIIGLVFTASDAVRPIGVSDFLAIRISLKNLVVIGILAAIWSVALTVAGLYAASKAFTWVPTIRKVLIGCTVGTVASVIVPLSSRSGLLSFELLPMLWIGSVSGMLLLRLMARHLMAVRRLRSSPRKIVIVGIGPRAEALWDQLQQHPEYGFELVGVADVEGASCATAFQDAPRVALGELEQFLMTTSVDEVMVALPLRSRYQEVESVLRICEQGGVHASYPATVFASDIARPRVETGDGHTVVAMHVVSHDWRLGLKRCADVVGAVCGLVLLSPVFALVAIAIRVASPGPVLFAQDRYGYRKRVFRMYKFRSMSVDAEVRMGELEAQNEKDGPIFKMRHDPRVTALGRFLRRSSLDELPQLWNVLVGDMSLVGPRPISVRDVSRFDEPWLMRRFSVRPGLTGLWQVSGRSELGFIEWMKLDLEYIDTWSLWRDTVLLVKTLPAVLRFKGAM